MAGGTNQLISIQPEELKFQIELEKQTYCDLKVSNKTENHIAFKVKTTSPKKYFVRPNTGIIHPWDSCVIRVTLQAQREYPPDMQCKDKFLLQSTAVATNADVDELPADTFNKESGKQIDECKLRVVYSLPSGQSDDSFKQNYDSMRQFANYDDASALQRLKDERDSAVQRTHQLHQELDLLKRRRNKTSDAGFSLKFAMFAGLIGIMAGFLLKLLSSSSA